MTAPVLTTHRLTLRLPQERDFGAFAEFVAQERSRWVGGPGTPAQAREGYDDNLAHWAAHGFGYFHVIETSTGRVLGRVGIRCSDHRPEPEVAYSLYRDEYEGRGYAREAAEAVRDWGFDSLGLAALVSYIDPANSRSIRLAEAMGARPDATAPGWDKHPDGLVYRHPAPAPRRALATERLVLRQPKPEDAPAYIAFFGSHRAAHAGGTKTPTEAWNILASDFGHWRMRGFGRFVATRKGSNDAIGLFGPYFPHGRPEREVGWVLFDAADEGKGLAEEAARACVTHAYGALGWDNVVSYIAPENAASIRLAERLGARLDADAPQPKPGQQTLVYRHPRPTTGVTAPKART